MKTNLTIMRSNKFPIKPSPLNISGVVTFGNEMPVKPGFLRNTSLCLSVRLPEREYFFKIRQILLLINNRNIKKKSRQYEK